MPSTTLNSILYLNEEGNFIKSDLSFDTKILSSPSGISIQSAQYVALPGFINCAMISTDESFIANHIKAGIATVALLSNLETKHPCVKHFEKTGNEWVSGNVKIRQISTFSFVITARDNIAIIETVAPHNRTDGVLFGSGNDQIQNPDVFSRLENRPDPIVALKDMTMNAARALDLDNTGIIKEGWNADLVLFKMFPSWDLTSTNSILNSIFMHRGNNGKAAAVFKNGSLVYADEEFSLNYSRATMKSYYEGKNDVSVSTNTLDRHVFDTIPDAIDAFKRGEFLVVVDNEDRENEGDLIIAGQDLTPEKAAFMIRHTSGVICAPSTQQVFDRLDIPMMVKDNQDSLKTAYTVSIDAREGTTTGISASDRSTTIRLLASETCTPASFTKPGHVFPLRGVEGGVLSRVGHTEASLDMCILAGKHPVAAISEIVMDDGRMARRDDLVAFAKVHGLKLISIADLVRYRLEHSPRSLY